MVTLLGTAWYFFRIEEVRQIKNNMYSFVAADSKSATAKSFLFIGNSFTFTGNVPGIFMCQLRAYDPKQELVIKGFLFPSYSLADHSKMPKVKELLSERKWDYVILQERSGTGAA